MSPSLPGLVIAAPRSSGGKTTLALGLMRALTRRGRRIRPFKNGPDYIDPAFHLKATGRVSLNLDSWAMSGAHIESLIATGEDADLALVEGSMGLFDGVAAPGAEGTGATADLAALTGWPVVLVLDVSGQAQSVAATALGAAMLRPEVRLAGVVLNRVASERHRRLASGAIEAIGLTVLGALPRTDDFALPERHLGLVQAVEQPALDEILDRFADLVAEHVDLEALEQAAVGFIPTHKRDTPPPLLPLLGPRLAIAQDEAFSFLYPHLLASWRAAGVEITFFSPLADAPPAPDANCVWLPGGYPELHAGRLASNRHFLSGLVQAAERGPVHGECGGYMVLGKALIDKDSRSHAMAGLLGLVSDVSKRKLHLGYRRAGLLADHALGRAGTIVRGHEFHYARIVETGDDDALFAVRDAEGTPVTETGTRRGQVSGSFFHLIA